MSRNLKGKALMVVGMQLLTVLSVLTTLSVAPVQGYSSIPSFIEGDWHITTNQTYWGGTCDLNNGSLIVEADATLTLHKVTLRLNPNWNQPYDIAVTNRGNLIIEDSKIMSGNGIRFNWSFDFGSKALIRNNNITDVAINWNGVPIDIQSSAVTFDGNDISNSDAGIMADGFTMTVRPTITNNTFHDIDSYALEGYKSMSKITGNVFKNCNANGGTISAVILFLGAPTFDSNTFVNNGGGGLTVAGIDHQEIWNSNFQDASNDIIVEALDDQQQPFATAVSTYNTTFTTSAINTVAAQGQGAPPEGKGTLTSFWKADVQVTRLSNGRPVPGAAIEVDSTNGTKLLTGYNTGVGGILHNLYVPDIMTLNPGAKQDGSPSQTASNDFKPQIFWANATIDGNYLNGNTSVAIDHDGMIVNVTIDDIPAPLTITEPVNGYLTNETGVDIKGVTDPNVYLTIQGTPVQVGPTGDFEKFLGLKEGKNDLQFQATKPSGMQTNATLRVIRDTMPPIVRILSPANGTKTNDPDPVITGTAEPGTYLTINGKIVPVMSDKTFNTTIHLNENDNIITATDTDKAGNVGTHSIVISLHTQLPNLGITDPSDNRKTRDANQTIKGIADKDTNVTINGIQVPVNGVLFQYLMKLKEGENDIVVIATDPVGNVAKRTLTIYLDTVPPSLTVTNPVDGMVTNQDTITVTGTTEPGATVKVNGQVVDNVGGAFAKDVALTGVQNKITVDASDSVGNTVSKELNVAKKTIPPTLSISTPKDGAVINGQTMGKLSVRGQTDPNAKVYVNGERAGLAGVAFQAYVFLAEGNNTVTVSAYDDAGNLETVTLHVTYDSHVDAEILTPVNELNTSADSVTVTGFVEPGSTVKVNNAVIPVSSAGGFTQVVKLDKGRNALSFVMTDKAGNTYALTKYVNRLNGNGKPSEDAMTLNILAIILIIVVVVAIVAVLAMGRKKKQAPEVNAVAEPPAPDLSAGYTPPPPDFSSGGITPPQYYGTPAPQPVYQQDYAQPQEQAPEASAQLPPELPPELPPALPPTKDDLDEPISDDEAEMLEDEVEHPKPEPLDDEEDMKPKKAPMPEDAPKPVMRFKDLPSDNEVADSSAKRKSAAWEKKSRDPLDEILDDEGK